ncbi:MAG: maleylpyruvate isomerase family mycothiol-dependent enzyme [Pseudonocardia sp.]
MALDFPAALVAQNRAFVDLTRAADPLTPVPTCPDWTLRQLAAHLGRGDRWAATIVARRAESVIEPRTVLDGEQPADPGEAADWLTGGVRLLVDAVDGVSPETSVWTFLGPRPAAWWLRRRLHETTVHRADAALALNAPFDLPADVAADGVSEWLSLLAAWPQPELRLEGYATMHLHATDDGLGAAGEWTVRGGGGGGIEWEPGHAKGTVAVRGAAVDLLLGLMRRIPAADPRLQVLGDGAVFERWLARTAF